MSVHPDQSHRSASLRSTEAHCELFHQKTIQDIPDIFTNDILPLLGASDRARTAQTCKTLRSLCQESQCQRLQELFASNRPKDLFALFEIVCPRDKIPPEDAPRTLAAIQYRVTTIAKKLPENLRPAQPLKDLVVQHDPHVLHTFLQTAYNYSIHQTFEKLAGGQDASLESSVQHILEWLKSVKTTTQRCLNLNNTKIICLPAEIRLLTNLQDLCLSNAQLTHLPSEIGQLTSLQNINLNTNRLESLPETIGLLKNLQYLNLDDNLLTSLPKTIGRLEKLLYLFLKNNRLTRLPVEIGRLKKLGFLVLDNNQLTSLPAEIRSLKNLSHFCCSCNRLTDIPDRIKDRFPDSF